MIVWVVTELFTDLVYEKTTIESQQVFSSHEKAVEYMKDLKAQRSAYTSIEMIESEVVI